MDGDHSAMVDRAGTADKRAQPMTLITAFTRFAQHVIDMRFHMQVLMPTFAASALNESQEIYIG